MPLGSMGYPRKVPTTRTTDIEIARVVVESKHSIRVVRLAYDGRHVHPNTLARIADAARRLGLPLPPEPKPAEKGGDS